MVYKQVLYQRIVSANGKSRVEAYSVAIAFGNCESKISQTVIVNVSSSNSYSSSSSSSSTSDATSST